MENPVIISKGLYDQLMALDDLLSAPGDLIKEAVEKNLYLAATYIKRYPSQFRRGLSVGFKSHNGADDTVRLARELLALVPDDNPMIVIYKALVSGNGYVDRKVFCKEKIVKKFRIKKNTASIYFGKALKELRRNKCKVSVIYRNTLFAVKHVSEEMMKQFNNLAQSHEKEEEMVKVKKVTVEETPKKSRKVKKSAKAKSKAQAKPKPKPAKSKPKPQTKPAADKSKAQAKPTVRGLIVDTLRRKACTKQELVQVALKSGLSQFDEVGMLKYVNLTFHALRKRGVNLVCETEPKEEGGGTRGRYHIED